MFRLIRKPQSGEKKNVQDICALRKFLKFVAARILRGTGSQLDGGEEFFLNFLRCGNNSPESAHCWCDEFRVPIAIFRFNRYC